MTRRWPTTLLGVAGALLAGIGASVAEAPVAGGLGWAVLAGLALSLMLHGPGLRALGVMLVLLAVLGTVLSILSVWWIVIAFVLVAVSGVLMAWRGPGWIRQRRVRPPSEDPWKRMDEGQDPTAD